MGEDSEWLVDLALSEELWKAARGNFAENASSDNIIEKSEMEKYYSDFASICTL